MIVLVVVNQKCCYQTAGLGSVTVMFKMSLPNFISWHNLEVLFPIMIYYVFSFPPFLIMRCGQKISLYGI